MLVENEILQHATRLKDAIEEQVSEQTRNIQDTPQYQLLQDIIAEKRLVYKPADPTSNSSEQPAKIRIDLGNVGIYYPKSGIFPVVWKRVRSSLSQAPDGELRELIYEDGSVWALHPLNVLLNSAHINVGVNLLFEDHPDWITRRLRELNLAQQLVDFIGNNDLGQSKLTFSSAQVCLLWNAEFVARYLPNNNIGFGDVAKSITISFKKTGEKWTASELSDGRTNAYKYHPKNLPQWKDDISELFEIMQGKKPEF